MHCLRNNSLAYVRVKGGGRPLGRLREETDGFSCEESMRKGGGGISG
jgi:hypothetical protein